MSGKDAIISSEIIQSRIYILRGQRVMLDCDLAQLYGVFTKVFNQAVKRHAKRFPKDFMFRLAPQEVINLKSQIVTSSWGGRRYLPLVFTEQGVAMLSSVLNSERAIQVNIAIIRAFVSMRQAIRQKVDSIEKLSRKIKEIESKTIGYNEDIEDIFLSLDQLDARVEKIENKQKEPKLEDYLKGK